MASDEDNYKRRREREKEREEEEALEKSKGKPGAPGSAASNISGKNLSTDKIDQIIQQAEQMIEQVDHLYGMFFSGAERLPPIERRKQLDQAIATLQQMGKPTPTYAFKFNSIQARYLSYRDRWDKKLRDLEVGKANKMIRPGGKKGP